MLHELPPYQSYWTAKLLIVPPTPLSGLYTLLPIQTNSSGSQFSICPFQLLVGFKFLKKSNILFPAQLLVGFKFSINTHNSTQVVISVFTWINFGKIFY